MISMIGSAGGEWGVVSECLHGGALVQSFAGDEEELHDPETDPQEWTNLATKPEHANKLAEMRLLAPKNIAPVHQSKP